MGETVQIMGKSRQDIGRHFGFSRSWLYLMAILLLSTLASLPTDLAWAQDETQDSATVLPQVRVIAEEEAESASGPVEGYAARRSATGTKTDTPLSETLQSITVVTRERIEDMGAQGLQDALNYAAGVRSDAFGLDSRTDSVQARGSFPDEYLDGLRQQFNFYTSTTRTDPYLLEHIEVLRGPAALLYGQGSTAGIVNLVSKRPLTEAQREIGIQLGSFDRKQMQADLTGPLAADRKWLYRLVALGRDSDTQVDFVPDDRALPKGCKWTPTKPARAYSPPASSPGWRC